MLPAGVLLLVFLTYPLGLGTWLGFTDAKIGRAGQWVGLDNFKYLISDSVARLSLFNTLFYTVVASIIEFALGLWLALLLNRNIPFKSFFRAIVLLPFIVPTALSALAFWWLYDAQFSVISWVLMKAGLITRYIDFLGDPWNARLSVIAANIWRGVPFVAICLLAGLQTISPSLYEAAAIDGWAKRRRQRSLPTKPFRPWGWTTSSRCRGAWLRFICRSGRSCSCCSSRSTGWRPRRSSPMRSSCRARATRSG